MYLKSAVLDRVPRLTHGFGTLDEALPGVFNNSWENNRPKWRQVHGVGIAKVLASGQECGDVDALFTHRISIPIGVITADCVPILMAHRSGAGVAAIHAGWRGTRAHILQVLWNELILQGEKPDEWIAAIGPSIGPCCYEVSSELASDFEKEFKKVPAAVPRERILDLQAINEAELKQIGIGEVEIIRVCTRCSGEPRFHSYRREGGKQRQYSVIMRNTDEAPLKGC